MIQGCKGLNYNDRLQLAGLSTLDERRNRGDLIQVFKIIKKIDNLEYSNFFKFATTDRTRGHRYKLAKDRSKLEVRKHFFSQRVINSWNELPASVVEAESVNSFKNRYDSFFSSRK